MHGDQSAIFDYLQCSDTYKSEKPYEILVNLSEEQQVPRSNLKFEPAERLVKDVRGCESTFSLDAHGFCWRRHKTGVVNFRSHNAIINHYLPEMETFIQTQIGAVAKISIFNWRLRLSMEEAQFLERTVDLENGLDPLLPTTHPHIDQSSAGAVNRCRHHLGDEAERLLRGRFRIINVWRPLRRVKVWPLAVCDASTVQESDLIPSDIVRSRYQGETYFATYNERHRWYFLADQEHDEVAMLKIYDSSDDVDAKFCLHSSFAILHNEDSEPRESIEVRAMVFTSR